MLLKSLTALTLATVAGLALSLDASATSRFTVDNVTDNKVDVTIFAGGDASCTIPEKVKSVPSGNTRTFGCTGNGKHRCKATFHIKGTRICGDDYNTCASDGGLRVKNGKTVVIEGDEWDGYSCSVD